MHQGYELSLGVDQLVEFLQKCAKNPIEFTKHIK